MAVEVVEKKGYHLYKSGDMRGYKTSFNGNIGYTIGNKWPKMKDITPDEEDDMGLCYDFSEKQYQDMIDILIKMKESTADEYKPDPDYEKFKEKREKEEKTLWWKIKDRLEDIGITITPFYWRLRKFMVSRPVPNDTKKHVDDLYYKVCKGFYFGPITITW